MTRRLTSKLSTALIQRELASDEFTEIKDSRYPIVLRFNIARTAGSWYVISGSNWSKVGKYPDIDLKTVVTNLPKYLVDIYTKESSAKVGQFKSVSELLNWFLDRVKKDRNKSDSRQSNVISVINRHLLPRLSDLDPVTITMNDVDKLLIWPLQESLEISTVKYAFHVLKVAFKSAFDLHLLGIDPLSSMKFTNFIKTPINPKEGLIHPHMVGDLLFEIEDAPKLEKMLILLMLLHGTRLSETRRSRWRHFNLGDEPVWIIPSSLTKTKKQHLLPLTPPVKRLLNEYKDYQKNSGNKGDFLFPGRSLNTNISLSTACSKIRLISSGEWSAHDLRKVTRTTLGKLGVDGMTGEMILNHSLGKVIETYMNKQMLNEQILNGLTKYHQWLLNQNNKGLTL